MPYSTQDYNKYFLLAINCSAGSSRIQVGLSTARTVSRQLFPPRLPTSNERRSRAQNQINRDDDDMVNMCVT